MSQSNNSNWGISGKAEGKQAKVWLKPEQVEAMRTACYSDSFADYLQERNEAWFVFAYDTGLRNVETLEVTWEDIDLDAGTLYLRSEVQKGKNKPPVTMSLADETVRILRKYKGRMFRDSDFLFPSRQSDCMTDRALRNMVEAVAVEAEVMPYLAEGGRGVPEDVSPHTMRHSLAYRMIQVEGQRMEDVMLRLRHSSILTTDQIYSHLQTV